MKALIPPNKVFIIKLSILLGITLLIYPTLHYTSLTISDFTPARIRRFIIQFGGIALLIFIALYSLGGIILILPVGIMSVSGGLTFEKWQETLYISLGAIHGLMSIFLVSYSNERQFLERLEWIYSRLSKKLRYFSNKKSK